MKINRVWAMPNKWTFTIPPITDLIKRYVKTGVDWIDPFAGMNSPAEFTNDLNPKMNAKQHLEAYEFCNNLADRYSGILFDPPYSYRQVTEHYKMICKKATQLDTSTQFYNRVMDPAAPKIKIGGYAISFGWNSVGFGKQRGFEIIEILLVCHGGHHNDTIVTVEKKTREPGSEIIDWRG